MDPIDSILGMGTCLPTWGPWNPPNAAELTVEAAESILWTGSPWAAAAAVGGAAACGGASAAAAAAGGGAGLASSAAAAAALSSPWTDMMTGKERRELVKILSLFVKTSTKFLRKFHEFL